MDPLLEERSVDLVDLSPRLGGESFLAGVGVRPGPRPSHPGARRARAGRIPTLRLAVRARPAARVSAAFVAPPRTEGSGASPRGGRGRSASVAAVRRHVAAEGSGALARVTRSPERGGYARSLGAGFTVPAGGGRDGSAAGRASSAPAAQPQAPGGAGSSPRRSRRAAGAWAAAEVALDPRIHRAGDLWFLEVDAPDDEPWRLALADAGPRAAPLFPRRGRHLGYLWRAAGPAGWSDGARIQQERLALGPCDRDLVHVPAGRDEPADGDLEAACRRGDAASRRGDAAAPCSAPTSAQEALRASLPTIRDRKGRLVHVMASLPPWEGEDAARLAAWRREAGGGPGSAVVAAAARAAALDAAEEAAWLAIPEPASCRPVRADARARVGILVDVAGFGGLSRDPQDGGHGDATAPGTGATVAGGTASSAPPASSVAPPEPPPGTFLHVATQASFFRALGCTSVVLDEPNAAAAVGGPGDAPASAGLFAPVASAPVALAAPDPALSSRPSEPRHARREAAEAIAALRCAGLEAFARLDAVGGAEGDDLRPRPLSCRALDAGAWLAECETPEGGALVGLLSYEACEEAERKLAELGGADQGAPLGGPAAGGLPASSAHVAAGAGGGAGSALGSALDGAAAAARRLLGGAGASAAALSGHLPPTYGFKVSRPRPDAPRSLSLGPSRDITRPAAASAVVRSLEAWGAGAGLDGLVLAGGPALLLDASGGASPAPHLLQAVAVDSSLADCQLIVEADPPSGGGGGTVVPDGDLVVLGLAAAVEAAQAAADAAGAPPAPAGAARAAAQPVRYGPDGVPSPLFLPSPILDLPLPNAEIIRADMMTLWPALAPEGLLAEPTASRGVLCDGSGYELPPGAGAPGDGEAGPPGGGAPGSPTGASPVDPWSPDPNAPPAWPFGPQSPWAGEGAGVHRAPSELCSPPPAAATRAPRRWRGAPHWGALGTVDGTFGARVAAVLSGRPTDARAAALSLARAPAGMLRGAWEDGAPGSLAPPRRPSDQWVSVDATGIGEAVARDVLRGSLADATGPLDPAALLRARAVAAVARKTALLCLALAPGTPLVRARDVDPAAGADEAACARFLSVALRLRAKMLECGLLPGDDLGGEDGRALYWHARELHEHADWDFGAPARFRGAGPAPEGDPGPLPPDVRAGTFLAWSVHLRGDEAVPLGAGDGGADGAAPGPVARACYVAVNGSDGATFAELPQAPEGTWWAVALNSGVDPPEDARVSDFPVIRDSHVHVEARAGVLLFAVPI